VRCPWRNEIVQRDGVPLIVNAPAQWEQAGVRLRRFENFNHHGLARQTEIESVVQQALVEVQKCLLAGKNVLQADREQRALDDLFAGDGGFGAVELIALQFGTI
jgi:hypothetical protein